MAIEALSDISKGANSAFAGGGGSSKATQSVAIVAGELDLSASTAEIITVDLNANVTSIVLPAGVAGQEVGRSIVFTQSGAASFTVTGWAGVSIEGGTPPIAAIGVGAVTEYVLANTDNRGWRMYVDQVGVPASHVGSAGDAHGNATSSLSGFMSAADKTLFDSVIVAVVSTPQANTTTSLVNATQLVAQLGINMVYLVDCFVTFQSAATTAGLGLGFSSPVGSVPMLEVVVPLASTAVASALRTTFPNAAVTTDGSVLGTGVSAVNSNHTARISGIIRTGATAGNLQIQFRSEISGSAVTLQVGSTLVVRRVA